MSWIRGALTRPAAFGGDTRKPIARRDGIVVLRVLADVSLD